MASRVKSLLPVPFPGSLIRGAPVLCSGPWLLGLPVRLSPAHLLPLLVKLLLIGSHGARVRVFIDTGLSQSTGAMPGDWVGLLWKSRALRLCPPASGKTTLSHRLSPTGWPICGTARLSWIWSHSSFLPSGPASKSGLIS